MKKVLTSSANANWCTPRTVVDLIREMGRIALDPCSSPESIIVATRHIIPPEDGLLVPEPWHTMAKGRGSIFVNPPYGLQIGAWTARFAKEAVAADGMGKEREMFLLVPARTDTDWWHGDVIPVFDAILFFQHRLGFHLKAIQADLPKGKDRPGAPFASALVYVGDRTKRFRRVFSGQGWIVRR